MCRVVTADQGVMGLLEKGNAFTVGQGGSLGTDAHVVALHEVVLAGALELYAGRLAATDDVCAHGHLVRILDDDAPLIGQHGAGIQAGSHDIPGNQGIRVACAVVSIQFNGRFLVSGNQVAVLRACANAMSALRRKEYGNAWPIVGNHGRAGCIGSDSVAGHQRVGAGNGNRGGAACFPDIAGDEVAVDQRAGKVGCHADAVSLVSQGHIAGDIGAYVVSLNDVSCTGARPGKPYSGILRRGNDISPANIQIPDAVAVAGVDKDVAAIAHGNRSRCVNAYMAAQHGVAVAGHRQGRIEAAYRQAAHRDGACQLEPYAELGAA